jgi:hypothetical protein
MNTEVNSLASERDADARWAQHDPEVKRLYGPDPDECLAVQAGVEYPEYAPILILEAA